MTDDTTERFVGVGSLMLAGNSAVRKVHIDEVTLTAPREILEAVLADGRMRYQPTRDGPWVTLELESDNA